MASFINNGLSALTAAQRALQTTSNNIANAGTDGYVRQRVIFAENPSQTVGSGLNIGSGVTVKGVERIYDQFLADELKSATMSEQRAQQFSDLTTRLDKLLANPDTSISQSISRFFDQAEALNRDPTSPVNRQQLLTEGQALVQRFGQMDKQLDQLGNEVDGRLRETIGAINALATSLAQVNDRISASSTNIPNDLLDEQERLLNELAGLIDYTTVRQPNGAVNVLVGNGQPIVLDVSALPLELVQNEFDGSRMELGYRGKPISGMVSGGAVAGLLTFRNDALDGARRELGQLASGLAEVFNAQHRQGVDLNGTLGEDFFNAAAPTVSASAGNTGSGSVSATITDPSAIEARDYVLRFDGSNWALFDAATSAAVPMTGNGTGANPFVADGVSITVTAGAAAGDRFLLSPVGQAAAGLGMQITDPARIAAASPLTSSAALQNEANATISGVTINDVTDPSLMDTAIIAFIDPNTYRIRDSGGVDLTGPLAYTPGGDISFNGWTVQIDGATAGGDAFLVTATGAGSGDNTNALALSEISAKGYFSNGQTSLADLGANMVANVGSTAARASQSLLVQGALREQAELDLESVAGVNLEEEAVNMLRYQEAYLAASKIISVANELFQNLLSAVGR
jgi:flagellar hook-associated protein 1 FlgK